jgi:hypothetical protein
VRKKGTLLTIVQPLQDAGAKVIEDPFLGQERDVLNFYADAFLRVFNFPTKTCCGQAEDVCVMLFETL